MGVLSASWWASWGLLWASSGWGVSFEATTISEPGRGGQAVVAADVNGDGVLDVRVLRCVGVVTLCVGRVSQR